MDMDVLGFDDRGSPNYFSILNGPGIIGITNLAPNNWYCVHFVWRASGTMDVNINSTQYLNRYAANPNSRELLTIAPHHFNTYGFYDGYIGDVILYRGELNTGQHCLQNLDFAKLDSPTLQHLLFSVSSSV